MNAERMVQRVWQFWYALMASPSPEELELARRLLTPQQMALFERMQPNEQDHSLRVVATLLKQGEDHPELLAAALLHDVGKSRHPLRLWERVLIVLVEAFMPAMAERWGEGPPQGARRAFVVAKQHPKWGAEMAAQAGASSLTSQLIRGHQGPISTQDPDSFKFRMLTLLRSADNQN